MNSAPATVIVAALLSLCAARLAESNTLTSPVLVDEFNARSFKSLSTPEHQLQFTKWRMDMTRIRMRPDTDRRRFIGGSDTRIIMGEDEAALLRLLREKRGEAEPQDLSGNLVVQLGAVTEELNRRWYE